MKAALLAAALTCLASAAAAQPARYDFRGSHLGMTLAEWKAAPAPEQVWRPAQGACSDDNPTARWAQQLPDYVAVGVIRCIYVEKGTGYPVGQKMGGSEVTQATYEFYRGRLFSIYVVCMDLALSTVDAGLSEKFGAPASVSRGTVNNKAGGAFPSVSKRWKRGPDSIALEAPSLEIDRISVTYTDDVVAADVNAARKAARGSADKL